MRAGVGGHRHGDDEDEREQEHGGRGEADPHDGPPGAVL
jgi:hypothetical protein